MVHMEKKVAFLIIHWKKVRLLPEIILYLVWLLGLTFKYESQKL